MPTAKIESMKLDTIVKGGTVVTPGGTFVGDVGIAGEKIAALGSSLDAPGAKAIDEGMITLRRSGLIKVKNRVTTIEEVVRETVK